LTSERAVSLAPHKTVFHFAQKLKAVLFTADLDFANTLIFPLGKHYGICVLRFPNQMAVSETNLIVKELLAKIPKGRLSGSLAIISPGKARLRSLL